VPLAHRSLSHGTVAFGFFNIESDMLLLEQHFFFATDFCAAVEQLASGPADSPAEVPLAAYRIERGRVGNLHGAIAGEDLSGFIGSTYRVYPFPEHPSGFKQKTEGARTRAEIERLARDHGTPVEAPICWDPSLGVVSVGGVDFDGVGFDALIDYVDRGGYPRWHEERRPAYVADMVRRLAASPPPWRERAPSGS